MQLISAERRKNTSALQESGIWSEENSLFSVKSPVPVGSSFSVSSLNQRGWVKSPVAITEIPLSCAHLWILSGDMSGLVAREYLEWMWRSAIKRMKNYTMLSTFRRKPYQPFLLCLPRDYPVRTFRI
jgi:hypothetical protein